MNKKSACINSDFFMNWLENHFTPRKSIGKVLLILDEHSSHIISIKMLDFAEKNFFYLPSYATYFL